MKAPKRLTFFLTKDICSLARKVYYEASIGNGIIPTNKIDVQNRKVHFQQAINGYYRWKGHMKRRNRYKIVKKMDEYKLNLIGK